MCPDGLPTGQENTRAVPLWRPVFLGFEDPGGPSSRLRHGQPLMGHGISEADRSKNSEPLQSQRMEQGIEARALPAIAVVVVQVFAG